MRSGVLPVGNRDQSFHDRTSTKPAIFCKTVFTSVFYIPYVTYVNSIRNAKDFFIKTLSDGPLRFKYYQRSRIMWGEYGRDLEIAQKVIEWDMSHVKSYAWDFELAQNSNHSVSLTFYLEISITCQNSELAHFFNSKILS